MSWLQTAADGAWLYRAPISVYRGSGAISPKDIRATVPVEFDRYWDTIDSVGNENRVTAPDGNTTIALNLSTWTYASRVGVLDIDGLTLSGGTTEGVEIIWLYWGNSGVSAPGGSGVAGTLTGTLFDRSPGTAPLVRTDQQGAGVTTPPEKIGKTTTETIDVWFDITDELGKRDTFSAGHLNEEEPAFLSMDVEQAGSSTASGMQVHNATTLHVVKGRYLVRVQVTGGLDANIYTVILNVTTTRSRVLSRRVRLYVDDPQE